MPTKMSSGSGDAEQVAGLGFGQLFGAPAHDGAEVFLLECTTDAEAVEGHGAEIWHAWRRSSYCAP